MCTRAMPFDRSDGHANSFGDRRGGQVLPVREMDDSSLPGAHRAQGVNNSRVDCVVVGGRWFSDHALASTSSSSRPPVMQRGTMNASVQVGGHVVDLRTGPQNVEHRNAQHVLCVVAAHQSSCEPRQRVGVFFVARLDLFFPPRTLMIPPGRQTDDTFAQKRKPGSCRGASQPIGSFAHRGESTPPSAVHESSRMQASRFAGWG